MSDEERQENLEGAAEVALLLTNFERLAAHLSVDGLASALVAAWKGNAPDVAQTAMLNAVDAFHAPKESVNDKGEA